MVLERLCKAADGPGCSDQKDPANFSGHFDTRIFRSIVGRIKTGKSIPFSVPFFGQE